MNILTMHKTKATAVKTTTIGCRIIESGLFPQILREQTTFYNSTSYCGRLHCSRLCFALCQYMNGIAPHGAPHVLDTAAQTPIFLSAVAQKRLVILSYH